MLSVGAWLILIGQVMTMMTACVGVWASLRNASKIQEVHVSVNSRMDDLLKETAKASHAEGVKDQKDNPS